MIPLLDYKVLNALYPFAFITDATGLIVRCGCSLQKLEKIDPEGRKLAEVFSIKEPRYPSSEVAPKTLAGELVILTSKQVSGLRLRGHVVPLGTSNSCYLFALHLAVTTMEEVQLLGLELSDFEIGTPIFDFLMLLRTNEVSREKLQQANTQLQHDLVLWRLLQQITGDAYQREDTRALYQSVIATVCVELGWDIGHVFVRESGESSGMISTDLWFLSEPEQFNTFAECTEHISWELGEEFPMIALAKRTPVWVTNFNHNGDFIRAKTLSSGREATAVAVPVWMGDKLCGLIEFISAAGQVFSDTYYSFFALLGAQVGFALGHHEAARKEREQLAAVTYASKMATLGEIAAGVAHEINNPISTISLISQVLKRSVASGSLTPELLSEQLEKIGLCVSNVVKIVAELRDFSRESSNDPFEATPVEKILKDTVGLCHARFLAHGISLQLPEQISDGIVECRSSQISQIILNLLNNAHDAALLSSERWVRVEYVDRDDWIELAVIDSGPGVPLEIQERIMQPFFTTKPPGQGTGLGLSISSNIAIDHGGRLFLERGAPHTCFKLVLPKTRS